MRRPSPDTRVPPEPSNIRSIRGLYNLSAKAAHRIQLGCGSCIHDEYFAWNARFARCQRDSLRSIPGAHGPDPAPPLIFRQKAHGIVGSANLEGADRLQALQLEIDFRGPSQFSRTRGVRIAAS